MSHFWVLVLVLVLALLVLVLLQLTLTTALPFPEKMFCSDLVEFFHLHLVICFNYLLLRYHTLYA